MLKINNITKRFGNLLALDDVSVEFSPGKITGLLGENGAGKSTLMNIIYGIHQPDSGEMFYNNKTYSPRSTADARKTGIGMVSQQQALIEEFTVLENMILGNETKKFGILRFKSATKRIVDILENLGYSINPADKVSKLDAFEKQVLEIAKILYQDARLIILDEPTSLLAPVQIDRLFQILERLKEIGKTIILVTHRISEVEMVVDDLVILRKGKLVAALPADSASRKKIVHWITGSEKKQEKKLTADRIFMPDKNGHRRKKAAVESHSILKLEDVTIRNSTSIPALKELSMELKRGEIIGLTGVPGNGQMELLNLISGTSFPDEGKIYYRGNEISQADYKNQRSLPIGFIFPDRDKDGLIPSFTTGENLLLGRRNLKHFSRFGFIRIKSLTRFAGREIRRFSIHSAEPGKQVRVLSGGNRQKIVLAREISHDIDLLVAAEPVRGLDIKTTEEFTGIIRQLKDNDVGILIISGDLYFLLEVSDKIGVLYRGQLNYLKKIGEINKADIGSAMLGYS